MSSYFMIFVSFKLDKCNHFRIFMPCSIENLGSKFRYRSDEKICTRRCSSVSIADLGTQRIIFSVAHECNKNEAQNSDLAHISCNFYTWDLIVFLMYS